MKKKILFLVQLPGPIHGVSLVNKSIIKSRAIKNNFNIRFINISTTKINREIDIFKFYKIFILISIILKLLKNLILFKPDKIYISLSVLGWGFFKDSLLVIISKAFGFKLIFHIHRKGVNKLLNNNFLYKVYYKFIFKNSDLIHLSKNLLKDIQKIYDQNTSRYIINNGIYFPINKSKNKKSIYKSHKNKSFCNFIFISHLFKSKGIYILLKAIKNLNEQKLSQNFKLTIVGNLTNDFDKKDLNNFLSQNKKFKNVKFVGGKYNDQKYKFLLNSHVLIYPTSDDCFPLTILEGMASGLAIISTYEGAIPEIIKNNYNGIVYKKKDIESFHEKFDQILGDIDKKSLIYNNLKNVRKFTIFNHFRSFERILST